MLLTSNKAVGCLLGGSFFGKGGEFGLFQTAGKPAGDPIAHQRLLTS